ncbi:MAG: tetratricopeptide repeat protein, partial [Treponemataceae bacterium]|nr:tetratricopeptide repeat protein [Treponemataceae bacterium]
PAQMSEEKTILRQNSAGVATNVSHDSAASGNVSASHNSAALENAAIFGNVDVSPDDSKKKKGGAVIAIIAAIVILLLLGFFATRGVWLGGGDKFAKQRENTLALAQKYLEKGQFDDAMRLLNELLQADINDKEADELLDKAIALKKEAEAQNSASQNANFNFNTDGIANALREQNERNQETINKLLAEQQRSASENSRAEEEALERKAAEEQRKKEDAERKAKEEALAQKNKEIKSKIDSVNNKVLAGKADLNTGNIDSALSNFEQASSQLPLSEGEPDFSASKYSEIAWALYDAASNEKDDGRKEKLNSAAVQYVNKALAKNQDDPASHYILGMNYIESGDWEKAQKELAIAVQNDPDNYLYYYNLGRAQFRLKNYTAAHSSFESSVKYNKNFDPAYFNLGMTCQRLKLNKDALAAFRSAHQVNPSYSRAYLEEARILNGAFNDSKGALDAYKKVIELDPVNTQALNECGSVYAGMGNYSEAENCYRRAIALLKPGDKDPITYYNLATALFNQNKVSEARGNAKTAYEQMDALRRNSDKAMVVYNYALIEDTLGNADKAITLYKEVLILDPNNAKTKTNLGVMFMNMDPPDADTALAFFLDAYKTSPSFELENNLGSAYLVKKDYSNAITYFQNAIKKSPRDNTVRFNLAQAYSGAGDFDNAKTTYLEILNSDTSNWDTYIEVAKVYMALKDTANAEAYLKILQQKNPTYKKAEVDALLAAAQ